MIRGMLRQSEAFSLFSVFYLELTQSRGGNIYNLSGRASLRRREGVFGASMRVVLQAESGGRAGHRIWLGANQRVFVGGTEWAEFAVPGDPNLADVQFVVESDHNYCRIRNLQVSRALFVNGTEVLERTLVDGDIVTAGATRFSVVIQETMAIAKKQAAIRRKFRSDSASVPYRVTQCESGLVEFTGANRETAAINVARLLAEQNSLFLLLHVSRSGVPLPRALERATDLFGRGELPVAECIQFSPIILSDKDPVDRFELVQQGWAKDAVVGIFASIDRETLLKNLQRATLWLCPPSVIRGHLATGTPSSVKEAMRGIKSVLMESDNPLEWNVFADPESAPLWSQLGFPNRPVAAAEESPPPPALSRRKRRSSFRKRTV